MEDQEKPFVSWILPAYYRWGEVLEFGANVIFPRALFEDLFGDIDDLEYFGIVTQRISLDKLRLYCENQLSDRKKKTALAPFSLGLLVAGLVGFDDLGSSFAKRFASHFAKNPLDDYALKGMIFLGRAPSDAAWESILACESNAWANLADADVRADLLYFAAQHPCPAFESRLPGWIRQIEADQVFNLLVPQFEVLAPLWNAGQLTYASVRRVLVQSYASDRAFEKAARMFLEHPTEDLLTELKADCHDRLKFKLASLCPAYPSGGQFQELLEEWSKSGDADVSLPAFRALGYFRNDPLWFRQLIASTEWEQRRAASWAMSWTPPVPELWEPLLLDRDRDVRQHAVLLREVALACSGTPSAFWEHAVWGIGAFDRALLESLLLSLKESKAPWVEPLQMLFPGSPELETDLEVWERHRAKWLKLAEVRDLRLDLDERPNNATPRWRRAVMGLALTKDPFGRETLDQWATDSRGETSEQTWVSVLLEVAGGPLTPVPWAKALLLKGSRKESSLPTPSSDALDLLHAPIAEGFGPRRWEWFGASMLGKVNRAGFELRRFSGPENDDAILATIVTYPQLVPGEAFVEGISQLLQRRGLPPFAEQFCYWNIGSDMNPRQAAWRAAFETGDVDHPIIRTLFGCLFERDYFDGEGILAVKVIAEFSRLYGPEALFAVSLFPKGLSGTKALESVLPNWPRDYSPGALWSRLYFLADMTGSDSDELTEALEYLEENRPSGLETLILVNDVSEKWLKKHYPLVKGKEKDWDPLDLPGRLEQTFRPTHTGRRLLVRPYQVGSSAPMGQALTLNDWKLVGAGIDTDLGDEVSGDMLCTCGPTVKNALVPFLLEDRHLSAFWAVWIDA